ncbi:MAG: hypothetical protein FWD82_10785, partial [Defluviitaleaceae bacterium]|nr:hypothetical protein [Defluviitaleaceae bacterium]
RIGGGGGFGGFGMGTTGVGNGFVTGYGLGPGLGPIYVAGGVDYLGRPTWGGINWGNSGAIGDPTLAGMVNYLLANGATGANFNTNDGNINVTYWTELSWYAFSSNGNISACGVIAFKHQANFSLGTSTLTTMVGTAAELAPRIAGPAANTAAELAGAKFLKHTQLVARMVGGTIGVRYAVPSIINAANNPTPGSVTKATIQSAAAVLAYAKHPICSILSLGLTVVDVYWGQQIYNWMNNNPQYFPK